VFTGAQTKVQTILTFFVKAKQSRVLQLGSPSSARM
jgi:hypothetical protein